MRKPLTKRQQLMIQRLIGIGMLILSLVFVLIVKQEPRLQDRDASAILITIPLALYYLFAKKPFMF